MPQPIALCLEDLDAAADQPRYRRCTALGGRQPGLYLDPGGNVQWQTTAAVAGELWVSADERLVLFRPAGGAPVALQRGGRRLELPCDKPVFVLHEDEILIGPRRLRLHVHGVATEVLPPSWLPPTSAVRQVLAGAAAAALTLGALATGCTKDIEVRDQPPTPKPLPEVVPGPEKAPKEAPPKEPAKPPPIEVRETPPIIAPPREPPPAPPPAAK